MIIYKFFELQNNFLPERYGAMVKILVNTYAIILFQSSKIYIYTLNHQVFFAESILVNACIGP